MKDTRHNLLEAACEVFARHGFQEATVAQICELAGANIASVNYYFTSKKNLYIEAFAHAFRKATEEFPLDGGLPDTARPEKRLKAFIKANLNRIFSDGPSHSFQRMLNHEMSNPVIPFNEFNKKILKPAGIHLKKIIDDILPEDVPHERRHLCFPNVISLFAFFGFNKRAREHFIQIHDAPTPKKIELMARHITLFALAGIKSATQPIDEDI